MEPQWAPERIRQRLLRLDARRRIYQRLLEKPGIHLRRLSRELEMPVGTLEHHLHLMHKFRLVVSHKHAKRRSFYAREQVEDDDLPFLHALRHRAWRDLLCFLLEDPERATHELAAAAGASNAAVVRNLRSLTKAGLVERLVIGRESLYQVTDRARLERLLHVYRATYRNLPSVVRPPSPFEGLVARSSHSGLARATRARAVVA